VFLSQLHANLNPSQFQANQKLDLNLALAGSSKNYLLVPLRRVPKSTGLAYKIDVTTVSSVLAPNQSDYTLASALAKRPQPDSTLPFDERPISEDLRKAVFYSRHDPALCF